MQWIGTVAPKLQKNQKRSIIRYIPNIQRLIIFLCDEQTRELRLQIEFKTQMIQASFVNWFIKEIWLEERFV